MLNFKMVMEVTGFDIHKVQDLPMIEYFNYLAFGVDERRLKNKQIEELQRKYEKNIKRHR